jgi:hypothetical protein
MSGQHKANTKEFHELSFADQANSIAATINKLQAAIVQHVEQSPRRLETIEQCLAQVHRLEQRLVTAYQQHNARSRAAPIATDIEELPLIHIRSPRLADSERAADFIMEVAEDSRDAGLR